VATVAAIELAGAVPVLIDIDPPSFTMDPNRLEETLKEMTQGPKTASRARPRALIVVHLYGHLANMPAIMDIARRYDLFVVEDCAQAHGAALAGKKAGTWGHIAAFSFYPTKNLGAFGDGGAIVTNDPKLADQARLFREYGWRERYTSHFAGMNSRLDELQAALLRVKLPYLDAENARRRQLAEIYDKALATAHAVAAPPRAAGIEHIFHQYVVRTKNRDGLQNHLKHHAIGTLIHYPLPVHHQPAYQGRSQLGKGGLSHTERACKEILSLPMHPQMTDEQARYVATKLMVWE
jgi:dTDP-4-amino-4,6-dideoxygalactose transaminase